MDRMNNNAISIEMRSAPSPQLPNIVVVENNPRQGNPLTRGMLHMGHSVHHVENSDELNTLLQRTPADIVILDRQFNADDCFTIAERLRLQWKGGIVLVSAYSHVEERIHAYRKGIDMCFSLPIDPHEFFAALQCLATRRPPSRPQTWEFDEAGSKLTTPLGVTIRLSAQENILLHLLMKNRGKNVPRQQFFELLRYPDTPSADQRLEGVVSRLRGKIQQASPNESIPIRSRYNMGYAFLCEEAPFQPVAKPADSLPWGQSNIKA